MKKKFRGPFLWRKKGRLHILLPLTGTIILMALVIVMILSNTYQLERSLEHYAETYANDVSKQLSERITSKLLQRARELETLSDTFSKIPDTVLTEELMQQKKESLAVNQFFIYNEDGTTFPQNENIEGLDNYLKNEEDLDKQTHISFLDENQIIYSSPYKKNNRLHLLISVYSGRKLQTILDDFNYEDEGRCCIINREGRVIVAPSNMLPFQKLKQASNSETFSEINKNIFDTMLKNVKQGQSGWAILKNIDQHNLIVGYNFLGVCDWMLLTVLPHDLFSDTIQNYTLKFILVALTLILITMTIIALIINIYHKNIRRIKEAALTDPLTDGENDTAFRIKGEYILKTAPSHPRAVVYLNNRDFRSYNARFGVQGGNTILCQIYQILKHRLHENELLSRCNGTSFCMLMEYDNEADLIDRLNALSKEVRNQLYNVYGIDNHRIAQGAYLIPDDEYDFIQMLDWAKIASTYHSSHEICRIFDDSIVQILRREHELDDSFSNAIKQHEFKLYIQPKICPKENKLLGGEVLVRWEHPVYGLIPPNQFIPLFEKNGKICKLDFYMFEETCRLQKKWIKDGHRIPLSVNLSRAHMGSHNFAFLDRFQQLKEQYRIPDGLIELELTESMILEQQEVPFVLEVMDRIQSMGFKCSLDDFGYGYSSLTLLKDLNVNSIKLDRQFFLNESRKAWIVVGELIRMAHELEISVVAEGIESTEQVDKLKTYNCDVIQGYVFAKPMSVSAFTDWANL